MAARLRVYEDKPRQRKTRLCPKCREAGLWPLARRLTIASTRVEEGDTEKPRHHSDVTNTTHCHGCLLSLLSRPQELLACDRNGSSVQVYLQKQKYFPGIEAERTECFNEPGLWDFSRTPSESTAVAPTAWCCSSCRPNIEPLRLIFESTSSSRLLDLPRTSKRHGVHAVGATCVHLVQHSTPSSRHTWKGKRHDYTAEEHLLETRQTTTPCPSTTFDEGTRISTPIAATSTNGPDTSCCAPPALWSAAPAKKNCATPSKTRTADTRDSGWTHPHPVAPTRRQQ